MDPALGAAAYLRLRAPRESGEALLEPPLKHVGSLLAANRQKLAAPNTGWLAALAMEARPALLFAAANYTSQYRNVSHLFRGQVPGSSPTILLAGHQPQLFHAGVWFKNFVLSSLALQHAAIGVNLIVDNDTMGSAAIRVPAGARSAPRTEFIPFDESSEVIPCEERNVLDSALFDSFGARVTTAVQSWLPQMVLQELWPLAIAARKRTANLGYALCEARHRMEGAWGLETLEVPLSVLYSQTSFHRFLLHLLLDLPRLHAVYNACLLAYRRVNHIRSKSHPVPDLAMEEEWLEAPLWIWSREQPRRRRLFVRRTARGLELTDHAKLQIRLSARSADDSSALEQLAALESRGIKLRPRALLTTMYARLVLSDLFLHGIVRHAEGAVNFLGPFVFCCVHLYWL